MTLTRTSSYRDSPLATAIIDALGSHPDAVDALAEHIVESARFKERLAAQQEGATTAAPLPTAAQTWITQADHQRVLRHASRSTCDRYTARGLSVRRKFGHRNLYHIAASRALGDLIESGVIPNSIDTSGDEIARVQIAQAVAEWDAKLAADQAAQTA